MERGWIILSLFLYTIKLYLLYHFNYGDWRYSCNHGIESEREEQLLSIRQEARRRCEIKVIKLIPKEQFHGDDWEADEFVIAN